MFFFLTIVVGTWLLMAVFMVCGLVVAAKRVTGRTQEEALAGMESE